MKQSNVSKSVATVFKYAADGKGRICIVSNL